MIIPNSYLQQWRNKLAGEPQPQFASLGSFTPWPSGNVYYSFSNNISAIAQKAFLDAANEWATFANLHFIAHTTQANYVTIAENTNTNIDGGFSFSAVGMLGGQQFLEVAPTSWTRATICHELGHTLGLVHEHQRSDRNSYVTILTNNILPGYEGNFILLTDSQNQGAYDFLSIMHYGRNALSISSSVNTIETLPAYTQYINIMGQRDDPVLSVSDRAGMATIYGPGPTLTNIVTNTQDSGPGSLRAALYYAFDHPGTTIKFNIPESDNGLSNNVFEIQLTDRLPSLWNLTTLDGGSEPIKLNPDGPDILLNGDLCWSLDSSANGLRFQGTNSIARSLVINGFPNCAVSIDGSNTVGNAVSGCYIGVDQTGTVAVTNGFFPVQISSGAVSNTVGGTTIAARNVISGSRYQGVVIWCAGTRFNSVQGNYIGINAVGTAALPNIWEGVAIYDGAQSNLVGGYTASARNVISGNGNQGVAILGAGTSGNVIAGNYIGLDATGAIAISNAWEGIAVWGGAQSNLIGGYTASARNVISGNGNQGVAILGAGTSGNVIAGNYIGLDATGTAAISNAWAGAEFFGGSQGNVLGGFIPGAGNVIAGNGQQGVAIAGTTGNQIQGNYIGLNVAGTGAVPNALEGIAIWSGAQSNLIGGSSIGAGNVISGNDLAGITIGNPGTAENLIEGNCVGLNASYEAALPNAAAGISVYNGAQSNFIGGVTLGAPNVIASNLADGIQFWDVASNNTARGNSMFGNNGAGIELYNGGNRSASAPVLTSAVLTTSTAISGSLTSFANTTYQIDFYSSPASPAQGMVYLGEMAITTGAGGSVSFVASLAGRVPDGRIITATATDSAGNTSRMSGGVTVVVTSSVNDGIPDAWRAQYFGGSGMTTNSQSCATCDADGDGLSNWQKFLAGLNPTNVASVLRLNAIWPSAPNNVANFLSVSGIVYQVQYCDVLRSSFWSIADEQIVGNGTNILITDPNWSSTAARFYRVRVLW